MSTAESYVLRVLARPGGLALALGLAVLVAAGAAWQPWLTSGVVLGAAILAICLLRPLTMLGLTLFLGLTDLSLLTGGGMKSLLVQAGGLDMNGLRLLGMTFGFAAVIATDPGARHEILGRYGRSYALFLLVAAAGLLVSRSPLDGLRLWFKLTYPFLVFLLVLRVPTSREQLERLMDAVLAGAAVIVFVVDPLMVLLGNYHVDTSGRLYITELSANVTVSAPYLVLMVLMALTRFATRRQLRYLLLALACAPWIIVDISRMAFLEAMVGLLLLGVVGAMAVRNSRLAVGTFVLAALLVVFLAPDVLRRSLGYIPSPGEMVRLFRHPGWLLAHVNTEGRSMVWPIALQGLLRHPLTGFGLGSTRALLTASIAGGEGDVHNEYIRLTAGTGIIGAGLLTAALLTWLVPVVRLVRSHDRLVREFALPAVSGMAVLALDCFTANTFDYYTAIVQYVFFLLAGALALGSLPNDAGDGGIPAVYAAP